MFFCVHVCVCVCVCVNVSEWGKPDARDHPCLYLPASDSVEVEIVGGLDLVVEVGGVETPAVRASEHVVLDLGGGA